MNKWVIIFYGNYEPSDVFGLFDAESQAHTFAETHKTHWDYYEVKMVKDKGENK